jgi:hypothetical protein
MTRNAEALASFVAYCEANPEQRFWQALRNWSRYDYVLGYNGEVYGLYALAEKTRTRLHDTFNLEGLSGTRGTPWGDDFEAKPD